MLIDSHCHLNALEDIENVIMRAKKNGVGFMLNAGGKFDELNLSLDICNKFEGVYTVSGVHPHDAKDYQNISAEDVLKNTHHEKVVAIGECGLDYYYDFSPNDVQIKIFKQMIKASQESELPIIVHNRQSDDDMMDILLTSYKQKPFNGVIHCYSSSWELAKVALEIGMYISASGIITFKSADDIRENFAKIALEKLLIETDTPYLAPVPYRGKVNEPSYVVHVANALSQIKGVDFNKISDITTSNFFNLFKKIKRVSI